MFRDRNRTPRLSMGQRVWCGHSRYVTCVVKGLVLGKACNLHVSTVQAVLLNVVKPCFADNTMF